eukprot:m51a1_g11242 hypothetical protein (158) ;mRNA; f:14575-15048
MAWYPSRGDGKTYSAEQFRGDPGYIAYVGDVRHHEFDCALAAAAAAYNRGPAYSERQMAQIRAVLTQPDNFAYYGTDSANSRDQRATNAVLQSAYDGGRVVLSAHEAAHIHSGAEFVARHKDELPAGFVHSVAGLYANVYDAHGHKVVDARTLRTRK